LDNQITFTDKEVQVVADFVNFVYKKAKFDINSAEAMKYSASMNSMHTVIKKMEAHIFEIHKVIETKKEGEQ